MENARKELSKVHARTKVALGLRYKGPYGGEREDLSDMVRGDPCLVYRPKTKTWEPYTFIYMDGETCVVQNARGRALFQSRVVKPDVTRRSKSPGDPSESIPTAEAVLDEQFFFCRA